MKSTVLDGISRELAEGATRRGFLRLLGGAAAVAAVNGIGGSGLGESAAAKSRRRKRGKRHKSQPEQDDLTQLSPIDGQTVAAKSIPPNCIYVCCDGTCDSWKMCLKCVKWPKPTTTTTIAVQ